jgi:hypothetical protein
MTNVGEEEPWEITGTSSWVLTLSVTPPPHPIGRPCSVPTPAPCPPGTFLSGMGPHTTPSCHLCPSEFFNPWHGQNACFPCGSEATQPEEGKDTCVCQRPGRRFQVCPPAVGPKGGLHFQGCFGSQSSLAQV